jgi:predicted transport protein
VRPDTATGEGARDEGGEHAVEDLALVDDATTHTHSPMSWACPRCERTFRQVNQRHACGVGSAATLLKDRPPALTDLYRKLETTVRKFGEVEVVTRNRYALFRTTRIFADLTVTRDALRVVVHLGRKVSAPYFIKVGPSGKRVSHVVLVRTAEDLRTVMPFVREAFDLALSERS